MVPSIAKQTIKTKKTNAVLDGVKLPNVVHIVIGAKVMVTSNMNTDMKNANGTCGEIIEIVLDPWEEAQEMWQPKGKSAIPSIMYTHQDGVQGWRRSRHLTRRSSSNFPRGMNISTMPPLGQVQEGEMKTAPYNRGICFTDYHAQGQTIGNVIIDLATPPTSRLTPFSAYVALSHSSGRDMI